MEHTFRLRILLPVECLFPHSVFILGQESWERFLLDDHSLLSWILRVFYDDFLWLFSNSLDSEVFHVEQSSFVDYDVRLTISKESNFDGFVFDPDFVSTSRVLDRCLLLSDIDDELPYFHCHRWIGLNRPIRCFVVSLPQPINFVHQNPRHSISLEPHFEGELDLGEECVG